MTVASAAKPAPSEPELAPERPARGRPAALRGALVVLGLGAAVFLIARDGGLYGLAERDALAVVVWWAIALMAALGLWPVARVPLGAVIAGALLAAFAGFTALSALWAPAAETALTEADRVLLYLGLFVVAIMAARRGDAGRAADGLGLGIAGVAALALASRLFPDLVGQTTVGRLLPDADVRLAYPVDYWNGLGILAALGLPLLLRSATALEDGMWRAGALAGVPVVSSAVYLTSSRGAAAVGAVGALVLLALTDRRLLTLWAAAVAAAGSGAAIAVLHARDALVTRPGLLRSDLAHSQGRSAAVLIALLCAATVAVYLAGAFRAPVRPKLSRGLRLGAVAAVLAGGVVGLVAIDPGERLDQFKVPPSQDAFYASSPRRYVESHLLSGGGAGRWQFWGGAVDEFQSQPVRGGGAGSFESWWAAHGSITYFIRDAHSLWLETLGELGLVGLVLLAGFFCAALVAGALALRRAPPASRGPSAALFAVLVAFLVAAAIDWMWELTIVAAVAVVAAGLLAGPAALSPVSASASARPRRPAALRIGFALVGLAIVAAVAFPLLSELRLRESANAASRGDAGAAVDAASDARRLAPWSSDPPTRLALLAEAQGNLGAARTWIERALAKNDADWRIWLIAARIETKLGAVRAAAASLARARALNPRSPTLRAL
jgi:O-antigen ligase